MGARCLLLVLLVSLPTAVAQVDLSFNPPGQWRGSAHVEAQWLVAVFEGPSDSSLQFRSAQANAVNHTVRFLGADVLGEAKAGGALPSTSRDEGQGSVDAHISFVKPGRASLVMVADRIVVTSQDQVGLVRGLDDGFPRDAINEEYRSTMMVRAQHDWRGHTLLEGRASSGDVIIRAEGVRIVEWLNATLSCRSWCPSGGGLWGASPAALESRVVAYSAAFTEVVATNASIEGTVAPRAWAAGGTRIEAGLDGWLRLPGVRCECALDGSTLQANGTMRLDSMGVAGGQISTRLPGDVSWLRSDETLVDARILGLPHGAAIASAVVLAPILAWLALRFSHNRERVMGLIQEQPGITFRGIMRQLGLSNATVAHHLAKLSKRGDVVRCEAGRMHHYFENHGKYGAADRLAIARLQEPSLQVIAALMQRQGPMRQKDVVVHARKVLDWYPSTTQRRLARLVHAGVLETWRQRGRWYAPSASMENTQDRPL